MALTQAEDPRLPVAHRDWAPGKPSRWGRKPFPALASGTGETKSHPLSRGREPARSLSPGPRNPQAHLLPSSRKGQRCPEPPLPGNKSLTEDRRAPQCSQAPLASAHGLPVGPSAGSGQPGWGEPLREAAASRGASERASLGPAAGAPHPTLYEAPPRGRVLQALHPPEEVGDGVGLLQLHFSDAETEA